jgi:hypothetical protein
MRMTKRFGRISNYGYNVGSQIDQDRRLCFPVLFFSLLFRGLSFSNFHLVEGINTAETKPRYNSFFVNCTSPFASDRGFLTLFVEV